MFSDKYEAIPMHDGIEYFIYDKSVSREEFHRFRAIDGLTDFIDTEFSIPVRFNKITIGHWSSIVNACTSEYLYALSGCGEYHFNENTSFHCCRANLRDKFMTIDQTNFLYGRSEEKKFAIKNCCLPFNKQAYSYCYKCHMAPEDVRTCVDIKERQDSDRAYNEMMEREFEKERGWT